MNDSQQHSNNLSPERRALLTIRRLQLELEALKRERTEPIAIIGMSCRFPGGANSPEAFWKLLVEGRDAITEVPPDRYDINEFYDPDIDAPGKTVSRWGGFLDAIDQFDPMFFGISPREANYLDPQQRLLLEVTWEALERAGIPPEQLHGSQSGVFIGLFNRDYFDMQLEQMVYDNAASANPYTGIGNGPSFAAGRLSYLLGLQGPSMVIDTVCSSSLVAIHLACQSLRNNECNLAFAGATNLIFYPLSTIVTSKMRALSPEGHCKTFDASADGFVRGEGCAVVILKRLSQALADGDPVLALIRGSAVNQDGRSNGLTAPNGLAQQAVIRQALRNAGLAPEQISYIEAHGTGTVLGDPIEVEALKAVLGQPRPSGAECMLGSVKTNIGHLESCAGMAGLIKTVLSMQHGLIPPVLHLKTLNPHISLKDTPLVIPTSLRAWPEGIERKYAGVGGAGLSGTNAHIVLEEASDNGTLHSTQEHVSFLLPISARDPEALRQLARVYQRELAIPGGTLAGASLRNICYTASMRRTHYPYRLALVGQSHEELASQLATFTGEEQGARMANEAAGEARPGPVFMFAGQGTQWAGMGQQLFEQEPVFRAVIEACDALLSEHVQWSLIEELQADEQHSRLNETVIAQPAVFAIQVALAALWRSWGIEPGAVVGHSVGEIAAAHVAGVLNLQDAIRVVAHRGRLMQQAHGSGRMAAIEFSEAEARSLLAGYDGHLSIGAVNSPMSITLSGEAEALEEALSLVEQEGIFFRRLRVEYAFHSSQMERFREPLVRELQGLQPGKSSIPIVSTVTGKQCSGEEYDAGYWGQNMCQEVRFGPAIEELVEMGYHTFLEISPQPALARPTKQCLEHHEKQGLVLPSLRQGLPERPVLLTSLGALYTHGYTINWSQLYPAASGPYTVVTLPTYQWQRKRYWFTDKKPGLRRYNSSSSILTRHPLLGHRLRSAMRETVFENSLPARTIFWSNDHQVYDTVVIPASAYVEMIMAGARETLKEASIQLDDLFIHQALALPGGSSRQIQLILKPSKDDASAEVQIFSCPENEEEDRWTLHASGQVRVGNSQDKLSTEALPVAGIQARCSQILESEQHYQHMREVGLQYGPSFQGVQQIWRRDGEALASIVLPMQLEREIEQYYIHPALLDACFQAVEASLLKTGDESEKPVYLPLSIDSIHFYERPGTRVWCHVNVRDASNQKSSMLVVDMRIADENGQAIASIQGLHLRRASREALIPKVQQQARDWYYELRWEQQARAVPASNLASQSSVKHGSWLIFADRSGKAGKLAERLQAQGEQCVLVFAGQSNEKEEPGHYYVDPSNPADFQQILEQHFAGEHTCRGILHLWSLDTSEIEQVTTDSLETDEQLACGSILYLIQAVAQKKWPYSPQLYIITQGSQPVTGRENHLAITQAPVWGLSRVIAMEQPDFHCKRIDLDSVGDAAWEIEELLQEIQHPDDEDQVAFRAQERFVARLVRSRQAISGNQRRKTGASLRTDSTYLITGGLGGLGLAAARWMVEQGGVKYLVLTGRSGASAGTQPVLDELERAGAKVLVIRADVSKEEAVAQMMETIRKTMPPLRGIIHAAGVLDDGVLLQQHWKRFSKVMAPKMHGSWNLHTHTLDMSLDFFVLFSSGASLMGSAGQGNYAAANAFMDALAHYRSAQGLAATSINWGAWADAGMALSSTAIERRLARDGMQPISLEQGMVVLEQLLQARPVQIGVLPIDWTRFGKHFADNERPPFLKVLLDKVQARAQNPGNPGQAPHEDLMRKLETAPASDRLNLLQQHVYLQVRQVLGLDSSFNLEPEQNLFEVGMDSLMAVELRNRLHSMLDRAVPANMVFDHPNIAALTSYLASIIPRMEVVTSAES
ncbi:MAG TPA: type I polyketide synthase [Ktedonobacteraceae bacterium]|nr:type I polyketide synthase [Ktedonobacteraceae bacterium]